MLQELITSASEVSEAELVSTVQQYFSFPSHIFYFFFPSLTYSMGSQLHKISELPHLILSQSTFYYSGNSQDQIQ